MFILNRKLQIIKTAIVIGCLAVVLSAKTTFAEPIMYLGLIDNSTGSINLSRYKIDTDNQTAINTAFSLFSFLAYSPAGTLYASEGSDLFTINLDNGTTTLVATLSCDNTTIECSGLTFLPDGTLLIHEYSNHSGNWVHKLYSGNPATGQLTYLADTKLNGIDPIRLYGIEWANGTLYGAYDNALYSIDNLTGAATLLSTSISAWDLDYGLDNVLRASMPQSGLSAINLTTYTAASLHNFHSQNQQECWGLASKHGPLVPGDCNGDNQTTLTDLTMVQAAMDSVWNASPWDNRADLDGDGEVTSSDLAILMANLLPRRTLTGMVDLGEDYLPGPDVVGIMMDFQRTDQTASPFSENTTLDDNGTFTLPYYGEGTYSIDIKASHWLQTQVDNVNLSGDNVSLGTVSLTNGDCDGNDTINAADLDILLAAMDAYPTDPNWDVRADLTGDLYIDSWDLALVLTYMDEQGSAPVIVQLTPSPASIYPGDNFTLTVQVITTSQQVMGLDHVLQVTSEGAGCFTLTDRNLDNSSFTDVIFPNVIVLYPDYATLQPSNEKCLSALVEDINAPAGPGTLPVSTLTVRCDPATGPGTYTFMPAGLSLCLPNGTSLDNITVKAATVEVLEGEGMQSQSMTSSMAASEAWFAETLDPVPPLNEVIQNWLMEKLGDDYAAFDPDNPPAYLSAPDARTAAFLWYLLQNEP